VLLTRLSPVTPYTVDPGLRGVSAQPDSEGIEYETEYYRQINARQQPLPGELSLH
jgi:hypothetical protein